MRTGSGSLSGISFEAECVFYLVSVFSLLPMRERGRERDSVKLEKEKEAMKKSEIVLKKGELEIEIMVSWKV